MVIADTFAIYMDQERARINAEHDALIEQKVAIETQLKQLHRDMLAVDAYAAAKAGKMPVLRTRATRTSNGTGRRGSRRTAVITAINENPQGLGRGELIQLLGVKGDKSGEMAVSNALTALTKNQTLARNEERKYVINA